jgi:AraC-like DNA-binding protein
MTDKAHKLSELGYVEFAQKLQNLFQSQISIENCIPDLNRILSDYFSHRKPKNPTINMAPVANEILFSKGLVSLDELADRMNINLRTFQIQFKNQVGLSPKLFCRIVRFNALLSALDQHPRIDILGLALEFGYSDNPHLYKDFKQFVGMTPKQYLRLILNINSKVELELKKNPPKL